ncbi:MAG: hypothetical protein IJM09_05895 [Neisseriaceae bacterium]|nr:hypothetical protein [Neisseriaceae bacterium]
MIATNATHSRNDIVVSGKTANDYLSSSDYGKRRIAKMISGCPFIVIASGSEAISEMPQAFRVAYRIKRQCKKPFRLPKNLSALPLS